MPSVVRPTRLVVSAGAVALVTLALLQLREVNPTTVALSYLIAILLIATAWGIGESTLASIVAVFCFNYFFLPPVGTLTVADPQNWVALAAFLLTAVVTSQLSGWARQRTIEAVQRQRDVERLYALSRAFLLWEGRAPLHGTIARHIAETFQLPAVAVYDHRTDLIGLGGADDLAGVDDHLRAVARQAVPFHGTDGLTVTPITLGGAPIGALALRGDHLEDAVLQSIANLAAIGLERARSQEATARGEAARESGELRATIMDALAHDLKTPLTAATAAATDLRASAALAAREHELATIVAEELDRLQALVTDVVRMLRIDAGDFVVRKDRQSLRALVGDLLRRLSIRLDGHVVRNNVPEDQMVEADRQLLELALGQLLDNAAKYSPPGSTIEIAAATNGSGADTISVRNSGPEIPEAERQRLFERFYRGTHARQIPGSGLGLAIVRQIAQAHGGALTMESERSTGTVFRLSLPQERPS